MELWRRGIPNNTTALLRQGILLKHIRYQSAVSKGSGGASIRHYGGIVKRWKIFFKVTFKVTLS